MSFRRSIEEMTQDDILFEIQSFWILHEVMIAEIEENEGDMNKIAFNGFAGNCIYFTFDAAYAIKHNKLQQQERKYLIYADILVTDPEIKIERKMMETDNGPVEVFALKDIRMWYAKYLVNYKQVGNWELKLIR